MNNKIINIAKDFTLEPSGFEHGKYFKRSNIDSIT